MIRAEAKNRINNKHRNCTLKKIIDIIYDDFEQSKDDFEQSKREQAILRIAEKALYEKKVEEQAKISAERKYKKQLHELNTANDSLVKENRELRKLLY